MNLNTVNQFDIVKDNITPVYFFKQSYDGSYNNLKSYEKTPNMKMNKIDPYVINKKIKDTLENSLRTDKYLSNKISGQTYNTPGSSNDNNFNNFIHNYIHLGNNSFGKRIIKNSENNKKYSSLSDSIKKQLEYLTCMVLNDSFKIVNDKLIKPTNKNIVDLFNNISKNTSIENVLLIISSIIVLILTIMGVIQLIKSRNISLLTFYKYIFINKDEIISYYKLLIVVCFVLFLLFIFGIILFVYKHITKKNLLNILSQNDNLNNIIDISKNEVSQEENTNIFIFRIILISVIFVLFIMSFIMFFTSSYKKITIAWGISIFNGILIVGLVMCFIGLVRSISQYVATTDNINGSKISTCNNISVDESNINNIGKVLFIFVSYVVSLICFLQVYTLGKIYNSENMIDFKYKNISNNTTPNNTPTNKKKQDSLFKLIFGIKPKNVEINKNNFLKKENTDNKQSSINILVAFIGTLSPYLKLSTDLSLFLLFPIPYFVIIITLRYIIYIISTILFRNIKKNKTENIIPELLSILFERQSSYFKLASKYGNKSINNLNNSIKNNIKKFNNVSDDTQPFKYLPYGLPWMTVSTIIKKIIMLMYYSVIKNINKNIKTSDIYYLSFIDSE